MDDFLYHDFFYLFDYFKVVNKSIKIALDKEVLQQLLTFLAQLRNIEN